VTRTGSLSVRTVGRRRRGVAGRRYPDVRGLDAELTVGLYQASTPDPLLASVEPSSVPPSAPRRCSPDGALTEVVLLIEPGTSGAVVSCVMRA
jgi:hypothetical protein